MSAPPTKKSKQQFTKDDFSDKEAYNEIKDEIRNIRDSGLNNNEEEQAINNLYDKKRQQLRRKRLFNKEQQKPAKPADSKQKNIGPDLGEDDEQEGQEGEIKKTKDFESGNNQQNAPSINDLGDDIRRITITRSRLLQLFKSRKFQDIIKGCFVRYKSQSSNSNLYMLGLVVGIFQGEKQYIVNNTKAKTMLRLQQSNSQIIKLSLDHVSNQPHKGGLEIQKWLQANKYKIPKEKELKDKLEELNNLIHGKLSSQEIDKNLFKEAERVSKQNVQATQNISELIFFMRNHIHDLNVTLQEIEGNSQKIQQFQQKKAEKKKSDEILTKLVAKQTQLKLQQKTLKLQKSTKPAQKAKQQITFQSRKEDKIRDIFHSNILSLCSQQGSTKITKQLISAHSQFQINLDF